MCISDLQKHKKLTTQRERELGAISAAQAIVISGAAEGMATFATAAQAPPPSVDSCTTAP
jgi:hypothetical protein